MHNTDNEMSALDDALIEDHFWWRCGCGAINDSYCGDNEFVCWRCSEETLQDELDTDVDWDDLVDDV